MTAIPERFKDNPLSLCVRCRGFDNNCAGKYKKFYVDELKYFENTNDNPSKRYRDCRIVMCDSFYTDFNRERDMGKSEIKAGLK